MTKQEVENKLHTFEEKVSTLEEKIEALEDIIDRYEKDQAFQRKWGYRDEYI